MGTVDLHPAMRETLVALYGVDNVAGLEGPTGAENRDADELLIEIDDLEAERFRLECERDARGDLADWPDGS